MESKITNLKVLKDFNSYGIKYGIYLADFNGKKELFIRNGDSIGVVTFFHGSSADKCVAIVRNDVAQELLNLVDL